MSRRMTVRADVEVIINLSKMNGWSAASLARKIGKHDRWLSEVKRGRNLPSPEEAAQICAILQVRPEDILTEPADVELVQSLIEEQKEKPTREGELNNAAIEILEMLKGLNDAELALVKDRIKKIMETRI